MSIGRNGSNRRSGRGRVITFTIFALLVGEANRRGRSAALWPVVRFTYSYDPGRAAARRTVVIVGASYSGTELAAQLRALADSAAKQMAFDPADVKFVLLDLAEQVMPEVGEKLGAAAMRVLTSRGIDVRLGVTLKEVHAEHVVLNDDSLIRTHTVAWFTGVTGAPLIEAQPRDGDATASR
jgi:NADH dehydrogenase FAD-containing subunit